MADDAAWSQGWSLGSGIAERATAHKQAMADEELQGKIGQLIDNRKAIQAKLPTLLDEQGNPTPQYTQAIGDLTQNARDLREVYHPNTNPGAVEKLGHLLTDALHITKPEDRIQKEAAKRATAAAGDEKTAQGLAAAAPLSPAQTATSEGQAKSVGELAYFQGAMKNFKALNPNATPEEEASYRNDLMSKMQGTYLRPNMKMFTVPGVPGAIPYDINHPELLPQGAVPYKEDTINSIKVGEFKAAQADGYTGTIAQFLADSTKSKAMQAEWTRAHYGGRDMDQLSPEEADQAMEKYKEESSPVTTSTGQGLVFDQNNQPHIFTHTSTSHKTFPGANGATPPPAATGTSAATPPASGATTKPPVAGTAPPAATTQPKTLGDVKKKAATLNPSSGSNTLKSPIGPALDGFKKMTPDVSAANKKYEDAVGLVDYADRVKQHPDNAQEQRDFAIMMERTMSGRFQTAAYDLEVKNSGIANTFQQWLNDLSTGALPPKILNNLIQAAHDYKDATAKEVEAAKGSAPSYSGSTSDAGAKSLADRLHEAYGAKTQ